MSDVPTDSKSFWLQVAQTLGLPTVIMCFLGYWAYYTVQWERDKMLPAIEGNKAALESTKAASDNSIKALETNSEVLKTVKESLDKLNKTTQKLGSESN